MREVVYCAGECIEKTRGKVWNVGDPHSQLDNLRESSEYLQHWCSMGNHLIHGDFTPKAYEKLRDILIAIAPVVMAPTGIPFDFRYRGGGSFMLNKTSKDAPADD